MSTATVTRNGHDEGAAGSPSTSRHSGLARRLVPIAAVGVLGAAAFFTTVGAIATLYNGCDQTQTIGWASYHSYTDFLRARATAGQDASVAQQVDFCLKWGIANNPFVDIATCNTVLQNPSLTFFGTKWEHDVHRYFDCEHAWRPTLMHILTSGVMIIAFVLTASLDGLEDRGVAIALACLLTATAVYTTASAIDWDFTAGKNPVPQPYWGWQDVNSFWQAIDPSTYFPVGSNPALRTGNEEAYWNGTSDVFTGQNDALQRIPVTETSEVVENLWVRDVEGQTGSAAKMWVPRVASMWNMGMFEDYKGDQTPWARSAITVFAGLVALTIIQYAAAVLAAIWASFISPKEKHRTHPSLPT